LNEYVSAPEPPLRKLIDGVSENGDDPTVTLSPPNVSKSIKKWIGSSNGLVKS